LVPDFSRHDVILVAGSAYEKAPIYPKVSDMTAKHKHDNPILVTGAAGAVGGSGRNLTEFLIARGHKVRALVRREDERAEALRLLGAEVVVADLTDSRA
jgi:NADPH:quinone reductase-like Zn-dependent oxidoreductase